MGVDSVTPVGGNTMRKTRPSDLFLRWTKTPMHEEAGTYLLELKTRPLVRTGKKLDQLLVRYGWRGIAGYYASAPEAYAALLTQKGMR